MMLTSGMSCPFLPTRLPLVVPPSAPAPFNSSGFQINSPGVFFPVQPYFGGYGVSQAARFGSNALAYFRLHPRVYPQTVASHVPYGIPSVRNFGSAGTHR